MARCRSQESACAGDVRRSLVVASLAAVADRRARRRRRASPATPSTASTATSSPAKAERDRRGAQRDRGAEDQQVRPAQAQGQARLLDLGLHVARRGRLPRRGALPLLRQGGLEAQAQAAGASTTARTGCSRWRRCSTPRTRRRSSASTTTGSSSRDDGARPARTRAAPRSPAPSLPWRGVEPTARQLQLARDRRRSTTQLLGARHPAALGADRRPLLRAAEPGRLRGRATTEPAPSPPVLRRARATSPSPPPSATPTRSRSRSGTSPTTRSSGAARPSPATTPRC